MDPIRTLLLARTHTVVLDPDRVAAAATRPSRDTDVDKFEDELLQLGFVMSLDLAMLVRRLPFETISELRNWVVDTLAKTLGAHRPHVPLFRGFPAATPGDTRGLLLRRVMTWLHTRDEQPCPWCAQTKSINALDPCGHLVCQTCWDGGNYAGCPICHRRVAMTDPFVQWPTQIPGAAPERVQRHDGELRIVYLAFDVIGVARMRFERLLERRTPLSPDDRAELEAVIDVMGPKVAQWLPKQIAVRETMAAALARLWMVAPNRSAMVKATQRHLVTATDVLRVAAVLMKADPALPPHGMRLSSIGRGLRRAVLEALEALPLARVVEDMQRHPGLWRRVGEKLHPYEHAARLPNTALAFATVRGTRLDAVSFGGTLRTIAATLPAVRLAGERVRVTPWGGAVETRLASGDARGAAELLAQRPGDLLRRADHLVRVATARQPDAFDAVLDAIRGAVPHGAPAMLLALAAHVAKRGAPWRRRVFFPKGQVLRAWAMPDTRAPLRSDAIGAIDTAVRGELVARAAKGRAFARGVIDRGLRDLLVPVGERTSARAKLQWPRGSEIAITERDPLRLFLHWEEPPNARVDLDLSVVFFDADWRHVATCDYTNLVVGDERAAVHSGDLTSAPPPLGASEFIDLHIDKLAAARARYAVVVVFSYNNVAFDRLRSGFAGLMAKPQGTGTFDPRAVVQRFDLAGASVITVPLTIDLEARRLRWIDVHIAGEGAVHHAGGYRAALAHIARDLEDFVATRPTLWDVAAIHGAARANVLYVRDGASVTTYRRRDRESAVARLARIHAGEHDGALAAIPPAPAPTWFALLREDLALPHGSEGYVLDRRSRSGDQIAYLAASDLVAALAAR